jgi:nicotinic acid mononucleotide adenylyltransferase
MHLKIAKDPFYAELYPLIGEEGILEAGFFYDTDKEVRNPVDSIDLLCTPLAFDGLLNAKNPAVLLCTGAYCPAHEGHIEMMKAARAAVEEAGFEIAAAYLSAGHDEYIYAKIPENAIAAPKRIRLLQELINNSGASDWVSVDPWESLFNKVAVNFTDVIVRLEAYIERHIGRKIPVFYVCGADNARFALSFLKRGYCVVVGRPTYEKQYADYRQKLSSNKNILWIESDNPQSSTSIRLNNNFVNEPAKKLRLRVEEIDEREENIIELLRPQYSKISLQKLSNQRLVFSQLEADTLISLDAMLPSLYNFEISRSFDLFGSRFLGFGKRAGASELAVQAVKIPKDANYILFDDDRYSGGSLAFAKNYLESKGLKISDSFCLNVSGENEETLDCRDFIIDGMLNGLTLCFNSTLIRVPYIYPYCCPFIRASIANPKEFSIAVWEINAQFFEKNGRKLSEMDQNWQLLFGLIGFAEDAEMSSICRWHIDKIS